VSGVIHCRSSWILKVRPTWKDCSQTYLHSDNRQLLFENNKSTEDLSFSWVNAYCASPDALDNWREFAGTAQSGIGKVITNTTENWPPTRDTQTHSTTACLKPQNAFLPINSCCQTATWRYRSVLNKLKTLELTLNVWQDKRQYAEAGCYAWSTDVC